MVKKRKIADLNLISMFEIKKKEYVNLADALLIEGSKYIKLPSIHGTRGVLPPKEEKSNLPKGNLNLGVNDPEDDPEPVFIDTGGYRITMAVIAPPRTGKSTFMINMAHQLHLYENQNILFTDPKKTQLTNASEPQNNPEYIKILKIAGFSPKSFYWIRNYIPEFICEPEQTLPNNTRKFILSIRNFLENRAMAERNIRSFIGDIPEDSAAGEILSNAITMLYDIRRRPIEYQKFPVTTNLFRRFITVEMQRQQEIKEEAGARDVRNIATTALVRLMNKMDNHLLSDNPKYNFDFAKEINDCGFINLLTDLTSDNLKLNAAIAVVFGQIVNDMRKKAKLRTPYRKLTICIDEADYLIGNFRFRSPARDLLNLIINKFGEYGVSVIFNTQSMGLLDTDTTLPNIDYIITTRPDDPKMRELLRAKGIDDDTLDRLMNLKREEGKHPQFACILPNKKIKKFYIIPNMTKHIPRR